MVLVRVYELEALSRKVSVQNQRLFFSFYIRDFLMFFKWPHGLVKVLQKKKTLRNFEVYFFCRYGRTCELTFIKIKGFADAD